MTDMQTDVFMDRRTGSNALHLRQGGQEDPLALHCVLC
jgi:hypothetical protein